MSNVHPSNRPSLDNASDLVTYHRQSPAQIEKHRVLSMAAEMLIKTILIQCPPCADTSAAIRHVRDAKMTASAAVALAAPEQPESAQG